MLLSSVKLLSWLLLSFVELSILDIYMTVLVCIYFEFLVSFCSLILLSLKKEPLYSGKFVGPIYLDHYTSLDVLERPVPTKWGHQMVVIGLIWDEKDVLEEGANKATHPKWEYICDGRYIGTLL